MTRVYVVDAGVLFSDWPLKHREALLFTTEMVLDEIRNSPSKNRAQSLISTGRLSVEDVAKQPLEDVKTASIQTGDIDVLSDTDIELVALALQKKNSGVAVTLVSTDLSVLNTAKHLAIDILDIHGKMRHLVSWIQKCPACGNTTQSEGICLVCGTKMRRVRKSQRRL